MTPTERRKLAKLMAEMYEATNHQTHYQLLGVHAGCTADEVMEARNTLARRFHPDRHPGSLIAGPLMGAINNAADVLTTASRLGRYRAELQSKMDPCENCKGAGFSRKQRGFTGAVLTACPHCAGSGFVARSAPSKKRAK